MGRISAATAQLVHQSSALTGKTALPHIAALSFLRLTCQSLKPGYMNPGQYQARCRRVVEHKAAKEAVDRQVGRMVTRRGQAAMTEVLCGPRRTECYNPIIDPRDVELQWGEAGAQRDESRRTKAFSWKRYCSAGSGHGRKGEGKVWDLLQFPVTWHTANSFFIRLFLELLFIR